MTSWVVSDSGILLAIVLRESNSAKAKALWLQWDENGIQVAAPVLFRYETVAVIRKYVNRGTIKRSDAEVILDAVLTRPVHYMIDNDLLRRGYELATEFNRPTAYDTQYLAVAERLGCDFWTVDERLYNAVNTKLPWVKWLGDFTLP